MTRHRARASCWLATTKSTPDRPEAIILLIALPLAPLAPHTPDAWLQFLQFGGLQIDRHTLPHVLGASRTPHPSRDWPVRDRG